MILVSQPHPHAFLSLPIAYTLISCSLCIDTADLELLRVHAYPPDIVFCASFMCFAGSMASQTRKLNFFMVGKRRYGSDGRLPA